jgi:tetratricopeptide (TPR) repeat protein
VSSDSSRWWWLAAVLVSIMGFAVYAECLSYDFVWDDRSLILRDVRIRSVSGVFEAFSSDFFRNSDETVRYGYYRPLVTVSYALDFWLWRTDPMGYHLTNILAHIACSLGLLVLARHMRLSVGVATAITLVFAAHPLHTESVSWVSGRTDVLATLFVLPYLLWFDHDSRMRRALGYIGFTAAIFSKEVTLAAPGVAFMLASVRTDLDMKSRIKLVLPAVPLLAGYLVIRATIVPMLPSFGPPNGAVEHALGPLAGLSRYMQMLVLPDPSAQSAYLQTAVARSLLDPWVTMGIAVVLGALYLWLVDRKVGLMAAALLLSFIPMANLVRVAAPFDMGFPMSERFLYLPSLVLALMIGVAWTRLRGRVAVLNGRGGWVLGLLATVAITGTLSSMTHARNPVWKNEAAMFADARSKTQGAPLLEWLYAGTLRREGKLEEAHTILLKAVQTARERGGDIPPEMIITLANTTASKGQIGRAIQVLNRYAAETDNTDPMIAYNLGVLQVERGRLGTALRSFDYACRNRPNYLPAFLARGLLHMRRGRHGLALESFEHVIELDPRHPGAWHGVGIAARDSGDGARSREAFLNAVRYQPSAINPRIDAAAAWLEVDPGLALELVETGVALHPNDARLGKALKIVKAEAAQR